MSEGLRLRQIESFLPLYRTHHRWKNGCKMELELPLFPSYVFVRMDWRERVRVLEVPGVLSLVGVGRQPAPLPDSDMEALRAGLQAANCEPHPYLVMGEKARIKAGPLSGMEGVLIRKKGNTRVVLTLDLIMQSVAVEVPEEDVEPINPKRKQHS